MGEIILETQKRENGAENIGYGKWLRFTMGAVPTMLVMLGGLAVWAGPFFHYYKPLEQLAYPIGSERYQNDDISCNFTYDMVLTGASMMENFEASRFDSFFGVTSVKIPYAGGYHKKVDQAARRVLAYSSRIRAMCRGLNRSFLFYPKGQWNPAAPSSEHLTDGNLFNGVSYTFNREVIFGTTPGVSTRTKAGGRTTIFDEYTYWALERDWGRKAVLKTYDREPCKTKIVLSIEKDRRTVMKNLEQNVLATAKASSQVTFHYSTPSYSISWQDSELMAKGEFERQMEGYRLMARMLLECKNTRSSAPDDQFDITRNLDHYMDVIHYSENTGDQLLEWTAAGEYVLTDDIVGFYSDRITDFHANHDHDSIYE